MTTPTGSGPKPGRHRRHGNRPAPMPSPRQVVAQALAAPQAAPTIEEPLTPHEIARLKLHFKFLREHRNLLKLRVNAAEDLLLNGVREPSHRGLCNHLLAKVERNRVLAVSQTMPPAEAVRLLGGIIRFAPDIGYILRYLECVKQTSSQAQAGAAVIEALKQINFTELSAAQMRQLVALIVDVFAERDLPIFLLSLLYDEPFRTALDRSLDGFPEVLGRMLRPLRAVHELIANPSTQAPGDRGGRQDSRVNPQALKAGVALLLDVNPLSLVELSEPARRRLLQLGCETLRSQPTLRSEPLHQLLESLSFSQADQAAATVALVAAMLAAHQETAARKLIDRVLNPQHSGSTLSRWQAALDAPRIGTVALDGVRSNRELPACGRWYRGWHVPTQTTVLVRYGGDRRAAGLRRVGGALAALARSGDCANRRFEHGAREAPVPCRRASGLSSEPRASKGPTRAGTRAASLGRRALRTAGGACARGRGAAGCGTLPIQPGSGRPAVACRSVGHSERPARRGHAGALRACTQELPATADVGTLVFDA